MTEQQCCGLECFRELMFMLVKVMMKTYCYKYDKDWEEGVHLVFIAARKAIQESLRFSSFDLVFGHTARGPLKLLEKMANGT